MKKLKELLILVHPEKKKETKVGSIIIPETVRDKTVDQYGVVEQVGPSSEHYDMSIEEGDRILFMKKPNHIEVEDSLLIHLEDVLCVLGKKKKNPLTTEP